MKKSAHTGVSKELWVLISKGLKHLNTVLSRILVRLPYVTYHILILVVQDGLWPYSKPHWNPSFFLGQLNPLKLTIFGM